MKTLERNTLVHDHDSFTNACPVCGLAPRQMQPLVPWGFEFLTQNLAPCGCGGSPVQIEGGIPKTFKYYCQSRCGKETQEYSSLPEAVLSWNNIQIKVGFDARKLFPQNGFNPKRA